MAIRGTLGLMSAEDILEWAQRKRASVMITFSREGLTRGLSLVDGAIVWSSSTRSYEQLGTLLIEAGLVSQSAVVDALESRMASGVPLGKVLQMCGAASEATIANTLTTKVREATLDVLSWSEGTFDVLTRSTPMSAGIGASVSIADVLRTARPQVTSLEIATNVVHDEMLLMPGDAGPPMSAASGLDVGTLWERILRGASAAEVIAAAGGRRLVVLAALAEWVAKGHVLIDRRRKMRTDSARELAQAASSRLRLGDRTKALELAERARATDPSDTQVVALFATVERARLAELARRFLGAGAPTRSRAPATWEDDVDARLWECIDGRWDALSILRSGIGSTAALLMSMARLTDRGVIEWPHRDGAHAR